MKKLLLVASVLILGACSSTKVSEEKTYSVEELKNWDKTIIASVEKNAFISEWYGNENPIIYLRKTGNLSEKEFNFLQSLETKETITQEDIEEFTKLVNKYNKKLDREFTLENTNIKNPKALVNKMVVSSYLRMANPSNHIYNNVATEEEWETIIEFSKQEDLSNKDVTKLRKILNNFIERKEFFDARSWYGTEISDRVEDLVAKSKMAVLTKDQLNNINAKALYIAYPEYFSELDNWED